MVTATLDSKGRIKLPLEVRRALNLTSGDRIDFVAHEDGFALKPRTREISTLRGRLKGRAVGPTTIDDMDAAIGKAVLDE